MSVKSVPGCLVAIAPILIGVPEAALPFFMPHLAGTVAAAVEDPPPPEVLLEFLSSPQAARPTEIASASATSAPADRILDHPTLSPTASPPSIDPFRRVWAACGVAYCKSSK